MPIVGHDETTNFFDKKTKVPRCACVFQRGRGSIRSASSSVYFFRQSITVRVDVDFVAAFVKPTPTLHGNQVFWKEWQDLVTDLALI